MQLFDQRSNVYPDPRLTEAGIALIPRVKGAPRVSEPTDITDNQSYALLFCLSPLTIHFFPVRLTYVIGETI